MPTLITAKFSVCKILSPQIVTVDSHDFYITRNEISIWKHYICELIYLHTKCNSWRVAGSAKSSVSAIAFKIVKQSSNSLDVQL